MVRESGWMNYIFSIPKLAKLASKTPLRFGLPAVNVSDISGQFYCEMKVDLRYRLGKRETDSMRDGARTHEEALRMDEATIQEIVRGISSGSPYGARFPLIAEVEGLPIRGCPDMIGFYAGKPLFLAELKTFGSGIFRLKSHPNYIVQAEIYGLLLDEVGFNCSNLMLYIVGVRRGRFSKSIPDCLFLLSPLLAKDLRPSSVTYIGRRFFDTLMRSSRSSRSAALKEAGELTRAGDLSIFCLPYSREEALENLRWARDYWLERREPKPTTKTEKCGVCEYKVECEQLKELKVISSEP